MSWLAEHPLFIIFGAVGLVIILLLLVLRTAQAAFLYAAIGVTIAAALVLLIERRIVTPREEVVQTVYAIANALETNDVAAVLDFVSKSRPELGRSGEAALKQMIIEEVRIKPNLQVDLAGGQPPTAATARFNVVVIGGDRQQTLQRQRRAWFITIDFQLEGRIWRVIDYDRQDPQQGI